MHASTHRRRTHHDLLEKKSLEGREPALINLPISLPSIPILGPVLTPIVGGNNQNTPTSTKRTSLTVGPTTEPQSPPTSTKSTTAPTGDGGSSPGSSDGNNGSSSNAGSNPTDPANGSAGAGGASHTLDVNAGSNPTAFPSHDDDGAIAGVGSGPSKPQISVIFSNGVPIATQTLENTPGSTNTSGDGENGGDGTNGTTDGSGGSSKPKVSPGVIAAICVIIALIFVALFIIIRRRRYIAKRSERRSLWWKQSKRESVRWSADASAEATAGGTQSCRSSFATTFDHASNNFLPAHVNVTPPLPPMAELRDSHTTGLLLHSQPQSPIQVPLTPALISFDIPAENNDRRNSTFSTRSGDSDNSQTQYLHTDPFALPANPSPMSVRPFSPSESFAFPKPPPSATHAVTPVTHEPSSDPFSDPVQVTEAWTPLFFGTEVIRRPFAPTLHDEIAVVVGEKVRVSKIFDDGWALVEKFPLEDTAAKGKNKQIQGLIPVDCLREAGQDLSQFITSTRVSSYSAITEANMATAV